METNKKQKQTLSLITHLFQQRKYLILTANNNYSFALLAQSKIFIADKHSKAVRSYNMFRIRSKNTSPEILVRKFVHKYGYRFRLHVKDLPGKPDIVFPKFKTNIFIQGCFRHNHDNCRYAILPKSNEEYWLPKIHKNILRDKVA